MFSKNVFKLRRKNYTDERKRNNFRCDMRDGFDFKVSGTFGGIICSSVYVFYYFASIG